MGERSPVCWCERLGCWVVVVWSQAEYHPFATPHREVAEFFAANGYIKAYERKRGELLWPARQPH